MSGTVRTIYYAILLIVALFVAKSADAQLTSPQVGWRAEFTKIPTTSHNVSGSVSIVDENTVRVDNFTYDGGGLDVRFYLGHENTTNAFKSGLAIGSQLFGTSYDGTQLPLVIDLPAGQTLEGWNAISVWCVDVSVSFGSGTFVPANSPLEGDFNDDGWVDSADYVVWRNGLGGAYQPNDYDEWRANFGASSATAAAPNPAPFPMISVPEPAILPLLVALGTMGFIRRHFVVHFRRA
jgi:hypothetical protein